MKVVRQQSLTKNDHLILLKLWNENYPQQLAFDHLENFETYLTSLGEVEHLCCYEGPLLIAWAFKFWREKSKWFALIVRKDYHLRGVGSLLLNELKRDEISLRGWVVEHDHYKMQNGSPYRSPLAFYSKHHFTIQHTRRLETPALSAVEIVWINKPIH